MMEFHSATKKKEEANMPQHGWPEKTAGAIISGKCNTTQLHSDAIAGIGKWDKTLTGLTRV